jgi:hypothetical protein
MNKSLKFIDELIEIEKLRDIEWQKEQKNKGPKFNNSGDCAMVFHLKELKKLVEQEHFEIMSFKQTELLDRDIYYPKGNPGNISYII